MNVTSKGQITIPANLRDEYGILPHSEVRKVLLSLLTPLFYLLFSNGENIAIAHV